MSELLQHALDRIRHALEQRFEASSLASGTVIVDDDDVAVYGSQFTVPGSAVPISSSTVASVLDAYLDRDDPAAMTALELLEVRRAVRDVLRPHIDLLQRQRMPDREAFSTELPGMRLLRYGVAERAAALVLDDVLRVVGLDRSPGVHAVTVDPRMRFASTMVGELTDAVVSRTRAKAAWLLIEMAAAGPPDAAIDLLAAHTVAAHGFDPASPFGRVVATPAVRAALAAGLVEAHGVWDAVNNSPAETATAARVIAGRTGERLDRTVQTLRGLHRSTPDLDHWTQAHLPARSAAPNAAPATAGADVADVDSLYRIVPELVAQRLGAHCPVTFPVLHDGAMERRYPLTLGDFGFETGELRLNQSRVHARLVAFYSGEFSTADPRREVEESLGLTRALGALRTLVHESIHAAGVADRSAFLGDALAALPGLRVLGDGFTEAAARRMVRGIAEAVGMVRRDPRLATLPIAGAYPSETAAAEHLAAVVAARTGIPVGDQVLMMAGAGSGKRPLEVMVDQLLQSAGIDPDSATARLVAAPAVERAMLAPLAKLEQQLTDLGTFDAQQLAGIEAAKAAIRGADQVVGLLRRRAQVAGATTGASAPGKRPNPRTLPGAA